jgi:hypothetical protein
MRAAIRCAPGAMRCALFNAMCALRASATVLSWCYHGVALRPAFSLKFLVFLPFLLFFRESL